MSTIPSTKEVLNQMLGGFWITQAIHVAADLGIADLLIDGPQTTQQLAQKADCHAESLYRVLRALASIGIFAEDEHRRFSLTPLAEHLRSDSPDRTRAFAIMSGAELYQSWGNLLRGVKTGEEAFRSRYGASFFEYMTARPERHRIYDAAMTGVHGGETEPMLAAYDFSQFKSVVDIGGGNGLTLTAILKRNPSVKGTLFDLPPVADHARTVLPEMGLDGRCEIVGGDFFSEVPAGADAYVMRHIIHDWNDADAATILRNCRKAMNGGGRVLVVEYVVPPGNTPGFGKWLDLMMLVVGGYERTEEEYRRLFSQAGLEVSRIIPTSHEISIIEGVSA